MKIRYIKKILWGFIIFISLAAPTFAHPHIFIDNTLTIVFNDQGLAGIKVKWVFDEFFTDMMLIDYDSNKDKQFSSSEVKNIYTNSFSNIKDYGYFTYLEINGKDFEIEKMESFSARIFDNRLVYTFFLPAAVKASHKSKKIKLAMYDESYFVAVQFAEKNPIYVKASPLVGYSYEIVDNEELYAEQLVIKFSLKKS